MANYHCSTKPVSRGKGKSATAAAAYRAAEVIFDSRTGERHDYTKKEGVMATEIMGPPGTPERLFDRSTLWNESEHRADRTTRPNDARIAREFVLALPYEIPHEQRVELVREFVRDFFVARGMIADIAFHEPSRGGSHMNYHAHVLCTVRELNDNGEFGNTNRTWNGKDFLNKVRKGWEVYQNRYLERNGSSESVNCQSYEDQGKNRMATKHLGPHASDMERRGEQTRIGDENRHAKEYNQKMEEFEQQENLIMLEIEREKRRLQDAQKRQAALALQEQKSRLSEQATSSPGETALLAQRQEILQLKHLDERRTLESNIDRKRYELIDSNTAFYDKEQTQRDLEIAQNDLKKAKTGLGRLTGRENVLQERVEVLRLNLEDIERRQNERRGKFDRFAAEQLSELGNKHQKEIERLTGPPALDEERESEDFREYTPDSPAPHAAKDDEILPEHDPGGPELDR